MEPNPGHSDVVDRTHCIYTALADILLLYDCCVKLFLF